MCSCRLLFTVPTTSFVGGLRLRKWDMSTVWMCPSFAAFDFVIYFSEIEKTPSTSKHFEN